MINRESVVYIHRNLKTNEIFYCGSGYLERAYQLGKYQRSEFWHLYVKNNNLRNLISIEIIKKFDDRGEAYIFEQEYIRKNYGLKGFVFTNSPESKNSKIYSFKDKLEKRSLIVSNSLSLKCINLSTGEIFNSITCFALSVGLNRTTLQKRINKIQKNPNHRFKDDINPFYFN